MKIVLQRAVLPLVSICIVLWSSNTYAGDLLNEMMRNQRDPNREFRESVYNFNQSMKQLSDTLDKRIFEAAMNDLFELIKVKGANEVTSSDIIGIAQRRKLSIGQTRQLFAFIQEARAMENSSQQYPGNTVDRYPE